MYTLRGDEHQITCTRGGRALAQTMLCLKTGEQDNQIINKKKPDYSQINAIKKMDEGEEVDACYLSQVRGFDPRRALADLRSASSSSAQHPSSPASPSSPSVATPFAAKLANKYFNDPPQPSPASSSWRNQRPSSNYTAPAFGTPPSLCRFRSFRRFRSLPSSLLLN
jgi:hypothetical protein